VGEFVKASKNKKKLLLIEVRGIRGGKKGTNRKRGAVITLRTLGSGGEI